MRAIQYPNCLGPHFTVSSMDISATEKAPLQGQTQPSQAQALSENSPPLQGWGEQEHRASRESGSQ